MPANKNILVVEDDPASQSILARLLKTRGYDVCTAGTGHEAMAVTAQLKPHLALVDIVLPEVSGVDFFAVGAKEPSANSGHHAFLL